jgi:DNA polymerase-1
MRTLLIDADVVAYQAASSCEVATHWGDGYWTWHCDENEVKAAVRSEIDKIMEGLSGTAYKLCLTDSEGNFRKSVLPTYKGNRANVKKPLVLKSIKEWMIEELDAYFRPGLEGDDCMGILATMKGRKGDHIIVSIDKDMKSVPGLFCRNLSSSGYEVVEITEAEADYWHLFQTLTGDPTDGYSGCPGVGPKKAEAILEDPLFGRWDAVVKAYVKAGLSETEALVQARVARILRATDYDFKKKEVILWNP